ncbi:MAG TPA: hypothetical protein VFB51_13160 [Solirubrobacterales bacterium]|nr:hypothetical protein [Solirubrobacterales bacterium]
MSVWVAIGVVLMVLGAFTTLWVSFLGAAVIASTPVFFTLRTALATRRVPELPERRSERGSLPDVLGRTPGRRPPSRPRAPRRLRDHD